MSMIFTGFLFIIGAWLGIVALGVIVGVIGEMLG